MTDSQVKAAAARCWIDAETPVRKPQSSEWTKLGDVAPAKRIAKRIAKEDSDTAAGAEDITTSGMILTSGEFELVDDDASPNEPDAKPARSSRLAPKLFVLAVAMLAGGAVLARHRIPKLDAELDALVTAMRPAPMPTPATTLTPTPTPTPTLTPTPTPTTTTPPATSSATLAIVPKMPAPTPKMREPVRMPEAAKAPAKKASKAAPTAKPKAKRPAVRR